MERPFRSLLFKLKMSDPFQSGFPKQRSTETALLKVYNDLLIASDSGNCSGLIVLCNADHSMLTGLRFWRLSLALR